MVFAFLFLVARNRHYLKHNAHVFINATPKTGVIKTVEISAMCVQIGFSVQKNTKLNTIFV